MSKIVVPENKNNSLNEKNMSSDRKTKKSHNNKKKLESIINDNENQNIKRSPQKKSLKINKIPILNIINESQNNKNEKERNIIDNKNEEAEKEIIKKEEQYKIYNKENNKSKEKNYLKHIEELENRIQEINDFYSKKISNLNSNIKEKDNNILSLSNSNNVLRHSLELLTLRCDKILYNSRNNNILKNNKIIQHSKSTTDISLEHQLKVKEKEIQNQQKLIKILSNDNKNIKNSIEKYNLIDVNMNLNDKLYEKELEINNLQKTIKNYKSELKVHNLCSGKIDNLNKKILEYQKEIILQQKNIKNYKERFNIFKNGTNRKNSTESKININTFRNSNKTLDVENQNENENESEKKIFSGNKTDRQEVKKVQFFYNKNSKNIKISKISPIKKDKEKDKNKEGEDKADVKINKEGLINLFNSEELICIKKLFEENEEKFNTFVKKINVIENYIFVKEKEMNQNIKNMENKMKKNNDMLKKAQNIIKEKTKELVRLNIEIKDLNQIKTLLIQKIKELNNTINEEKNNNQILKEENLRIKNSIFSIDGIIAGNIIKEKSEKYKVISNNDKEKIEYNINFKDKDNNKKEGYRANPGIEMEEEKNINKKFFTNQSLSISKNIQEKYSAEDDNKV